MLLFGSLTLRKGVGDLLNAVASHHWLQDVQLLMTGWQDHDVKDIMARPALQQAACDGRIQTIDRFISDEERDAALAAFAMPSGAAIAASTR